MPAQNSNIFHKVLFFPNFYSSRCVGAIRDEASSPLGEAPEKRARRSESFWEIKMEQDQHERRLAKLQKRMATDIGDFVVIAAAAFGIGFGRYLAEYKVRFRKERWNTPGNCCGSLLNKCQGDCQTLSNFKPIRRALKSCICSRSPGTWLRPWPPFPLLGLFCLWSSPLP